jgi:O-antigen ligase
MSDLNKINGLTDKYFFYSFIIFIPSLVLGPAIPDFIIITSSILFLIFKIKYFDLKKYKNYIMFFLIFYFLIIISSLLSDYQLWSLKSSLFYIRFFLYFLVVCYLIENYTFIYKYLLVITFLTFLLLFIDTIFQFTFGFNLIGFPVQEDVHRIASFFKDEYILGSYILRIFPIILFCISLFKFSKNYKNLLNFFIFFISGLIIILSGDRTPLLLFFIYLSLYFLISDNKKNIFIIFLFFLIIFSSIIFTNSDIKKRVVDQTILELGLTDKKPGYFFEKKGLFFFSPQHEKLFKTSINIFDDNKYFGVGPNNFRYSCDSLKYKAESKNHYNCYNHPHNLFIQILAECGIFVFLLLLLFYLYLIKNYLTFFSKSHTKNLYNLDLSLILLIISTLVNLFPFAPSGNFFNNNLSMFNFLCIALFFSYLKNQKQINKNLDNFLD